MPRPGGLRSPLTDAQRDLAGRHAALALKLARAAGRGHDDPDEIESEYGWVLARAPARHRPGRLAFGRYLRRRLDGARADVARRYSIRRARHLPSQDAVDRSPVGREMEEADAVEGWLRKLPGGHAAAMRRIYLHGETHAEAGLALGLSASRVGVIHRQSVAMLRRCSPCP